MREIRIYHPELLTLNTQVSLTSDASHHVGKVLRMQIGQPLSLFDGTGHIFEANIIDMNKKSVTVTVSDSRYEQVESPVKIHLGQVISRGDKMELTIQKAVELGVDAITPLYSSRCGVKLDDERAHKKHLQWQKIIIAACEQCGRNDIPTLHPMESLSSWCQKEGADLRLTLHPRANHGINQLSLPRDNASIDLLIGSEGGLTAEEIEMTLSHQFQEILLGPRVLRTETAALTAIAVLQAKFGDLG